MTTLTTEARYLVILVVVVVVVATTVVVVVVVVLSRFAVVLPAVVAINRAIIVHI